MIQSAGLGPRNWMQRYCPSVNGQFLFLDPVSWETHLLSKGAVLILSEAADAIEEQRFDAFLAEIAQAGEWPPGLEFLARSLTTLPAPERTTAQG
ncbi:MAG: hypothetical protein EYC67_09965 [Betaproteobacteria bacterium]|nr:MAG: hypothetical protein EYC67_09965 [Betaproteobacteria bacterium]